jgi:hypothetical protein
VFAPPTIATQAPFPQGLHDPTSGLGNDSWWTGAANRCDLDVYVK